MPNPTDPRSPSPALYVLIAVTLLVSLGCLVFVVKGQMESREAREEVTALRSDIRNLKAETSAVPTPVAEKAMPSPATGTEWVTANYQDISFSYPKGWYLNTEKDAFVEGQTNLRLDSAAGELRIGGGPGTEGVVYFEKGYQMYLREIDKRQYNDFPLTATTNPNVKKVTFVCDGAGCTEEQYLFEKDGRRYVIEVYNLMEPAAPGDAVTKTIVASMK